MTYYGNSTAGADQGQDIGGDAPDGWECPYCEHIFWVASAWSEGDVGGVIFHSDRGSEYTAAATARACQALGIVQSMGRVGSALDNAAAESFNSTLKVEFVHRHRFATRAEARIKIATWIADFYNTTRRHSANDGLAPIAFEHQIAQARAVSVAQVSADVA